MSRRFRAGLFSIAVLTSACGADPMAPPSPQQADAAADRPSLDTRADAMQGETGRDAAPDVAVAPDVRPDSRPMATGRALPAGVPSPRRFLEGDARLAGGGKSSCSNQEPASGDGHRWCAFWRKEATSPVAELWVIDLTRAAAGDVPACDGSNPGCLRLTTNLWTGSSLNGPSHPYSHEFHGDTLLFYADAVSAPGEFYRGPVYAWRPEWASPRRIASDKGIICAGHERALVAYCLEDILGDPMRPESFEVRVGEIGDRDGIVLPSLGRVRPARADGAFSWQANFSPAGDLFILSSADPDPTVESIRVVPVREAGRTAPAVIVRDARFWQPSNDARRIFFYRPEPPDEDALHVADFPTGANPIKLDSKVTDYLLLGKPGIDAGIVFVKRLDPDRGAFQLLQNARSPTTAKTVFEYSDILEDVHLSPDLRFTGWADGGFTVRIVRNSDLRSCELNVKTESAAFEPTFLENAGLVFWVEDTGGDFSERDGYFADPDGCQGKQRFAQSVTFTVAVGDRGLIFFDEHDSFSDTGTLKYAPITGGKQWPADGAVRIADTIENWSTTFVGEKPMFLIFNVKAGGAAAQGTYVFGPVPL